MAPRSEDPKLIIRVINFVLVQPIYAHGTSASQRDGQTDGRTTYDSNTALALRASRGKNERKGRKNSQSRYISRNSREAPCERILTKFRRSRDMADVIICAKFGF